MIEVPLLTPDELLVLELLAEATLAFALLPEHHPSDLIEWAQDVHRLQYRVMARAAVRGVSFPWTPMVRRTPPRGDMAKP